MVTWEYALIVRRRLAATHDTGWETTFAWYGPDGTVLDVTAYGDTAIAHLNRAGAQGWELVSVTEDPSMEGMNDLQRYHMKRPIQTAAPRQRLRAANRAGRR